MRRLFFMLLALALVIAPAIDQGLVHVPAQAMAASLDHDHGDHGGHADHKPGPEGGYVCKAPTSVAGAILVMPPPTPQPQVMSLVRNVTTPRQMVASPPSPLERPPRFIPA